MAKEACSIEHCSERMPDRAVVSLAFAFRSADAANCVVSGSFKRLKEIAGVGFEPTTFRL